MNAQIYAAEAYEQDEDNQQNRHYPSYCCFIAEEEDHVYAEAIDHGGGKGVTARKTVAEDEQIRFWPGSLKNKLEKDKRRRTRGDRQNM